MTEFYSCLPLWTLIYFILRRKNKTCETHILEICDPLSFCCFHTLSSVTYWLSCVPSDFKTFLLQPLNKPPLVSHQRWSLFAFASSNHTSGIQFCLSLWSMLHCLLHILSVACHKAPFSDPYYFQYTCFHLQQFVTIVTYVTLFIYLSIHYGNHSKGHESVGAYPSCHWTRDRR